MSEIYRKGTLEYLGTDGVSQAVIENVAFRMRGNTSRQWPEGGSYVDGLWRPGPSRFHFNIKFDEDFSEDESVYSCINEAGEVAPWFLDGCGGRVAKDIPEIPENKDRTFWGLESFALKFNKDDPSYIRESLAHTILNDAGVVAGRTTHVALELVIVAGDGITELFERPLPQTYQMGVYTLTEPVDKIFVKREFGKNGYLFKVGGGDLSHHDANSCIPFEARGSLDVSSEFCHIGVEQVDPANRSEWLGLDLINDINADGTVTDNRTGLVWDRCTWGQTGDDCSGGAATSHTWQGALAQAEAANSANYKGHSDWRLPDIKELTSIVERSCIHPAINLALFPNTLSYFLWSSSPHFGYAGLVWGLDFQWGAVYGDGYTHHNQYTMIRLVRGGQ